MYQHDLDRTQTRKWLATGGYCNWDVHLVGSPLILGSKTLLGSSHLILVSTHSHTIVYLDPLITSFTYTDIFGVAIAIVIDQLPPSGFFGGTSHASRGPREEGQELLGAGMGRMDPWMKPWRKRESSWKSGRGFFMWTYYDIFGSFLDNFEVSWKVFEGCDGNLGLIWQFRAEEYKESGMTCVAFERPCSCG